MIIGGGIGAVHLRFTAVFGVQLFGVGDLTSHFVLPPLSKTEHPWVIVFKAKCKLLGLVRLQ